MSGDNQDIGEKPSGKKVRKLSQKEHSERFKEIARELEADDSGSAFDAVVGRILIPRNAESN